VTALYVRIHYAIDFTDESYYVALPYSFTLGHRPIVDELAVHQLAGLLGEPLVRLHLWINGSSSGLVLAMRHFYLGFAMLSGALVARTLTRTIGAGAGLGVGAFALAYVPFCIPNLGYNSIASLGLVAGLFALADSTVAARPARSLFFGTLFLALATIAYPPLAIATLPATAGVTWLVARRNDPVLLEGRLRRVVPVLVAGGLAAVWLAARLGPHLSLEHLHRMVELNDAVAMQGGGSEKLERITRLLGFERRLLGAQAAALAATVLALRLVRPTWLATGLLLLTGPALFAASYLYVPVVEPYTTMPFAILILGFVSPLALRLTRSERPAALQTGLWVIATTSIVAGVCVAWATANGPRNAALGLLPAALVSLASIVSVPPRAGSTRSRATIPRFAFLASLLAFALFDLGTHVYRDHPIEELTVAVESGAYSGIRTTPERRDFIEQLQTDLAAVATPGRSILAFDYFPAGYLLSEARPHTPALWMFLLRTENRLRHPTRRVYAGHYHSPEALPDVLLEMHSMIVSYERGVRRPRWDPVRAQLRAGDYATAVTRDRYVISVKRGAGSGDGPIAHPENDEAPPDPVAPAYRFRN